jgi:serine protease Do
MSRSSCFGWLKRIVFKLIESIALVAFASSIAFAQINSCKYLFIADFTSDPYGIEKQLRVQAGERGFIVIMSASERPETEAFATCVLQGTWSANGVGGEVSIRVSDAVNHQTLAEAQARGTNWWGVNRTVRIAVSKLYDQIHYTGFSQNEFDARMQREYPPRPKVQLTEDQVTKSSPHSKVEGIWSDPEDHYRIAIVPAPSGTAADYVGVLLRTNSPVWEPGEVKAEFSSTASPDIFTCRYFMGNKKPTGTTFIIDHDALMKATVSFQNRTEELILLRVWPKLSTDTAGSATPTSGSAGTGFILNTNGLVATNWHVVKDARHITISFPEVRERITAEVALRDTVNDLAILRMSDPTKIPVSCAKLPYQLVATKQVVLGEHVSTIGYPLTPLLGANPKFSEGVVSSKTGLQDDPRTLQVSAQVQPGSSGGPLFDSDGNVVGIIVATLDAGKLYESASVLPQNVNFAIKSDYLLNLLGMLPGETAGNRATSFTPEKAANCIGGVAAF